MVGRNMVILFVLFWNSLAVYASTSTTAPPSIKDLTCNFESGNTCGWTLQSNHLKWTIAKGSSFHGMVDHTTRTAKGSFLTTTGQDKVAGNASLVSHKLAGGIMYCFVVHWRSPVQDSAKLTVYKHTKNLQIPVFRSKGTKSTYWKRSEIKIGARKPFLISIDSAQTSGKSGQIFLDDIQIKAGTCPPERLVSASPVAVNPGTTPIPSIQDLTCTFESGNTCGWTLQSNHLKWTIAKGSSFHGMVDHTTHTAKGSFLTTTGQDKVAGNASLVSHNVAGGIKYCLVIHWRSPVQDSANLTVYKIIKNYLLIPKFHSGGNKSTGWQRSEIKMAAKDPFKIHIESSQNSGKSGQIFLDDIQLTPGVCTPETSEVTPPEVRGVAVGKPVVAGKGASSGHSLVQNMTCSFESGDTCNWTLQSDKLSWVVNSASSFGMIHHSGHVLTTTGQAHVKGTATIISPKMNGGSYCFIFHIQAPNNGSVDLHVYKKLKNLDVQLLKTQNKKYPRWEMMEVTLRARDEFRVGVVSEQDSGNPGQIFLDNFQLTQGVCPKRPTTTITPTTPTIESGSAKSSKQNRSSKPESWKVGAGVGTGLFVVVVVIGGFLVWRRNKKYNSGDINTPQVSAEDDEGFVAFNNPIYPRVHAEEKTEENTDSRISYNNSEKQGEVEQNVYSNLHFEDQGEANA